jgi:hypothetical protein
MDVEGSAPLKRRAWRIVLAYTAGIVAGVAVAVFASATGASDNVYVMFAVLLVVMAALLGGTGPAVTVAITVVVGDDLVLSGRTASARAVERRGYFRHDCHYRRPARLRQA